MLHFTCDLCGTRLEDERYVVKMEVYPAFDPDAFDEEDLTDDHLEQVAEILEAAENGVPPVIEDQSAKSLRFDLCCDCRRRFLADPLGREAATRFDFSEN